MATQSNRCQLFDIVRGPIMELNYIEICNKLRTLYDMVSVNNDPTLSSHICIMFDCYETGSPFSYKYFTKEHDYIKHVTDEQMVVYKSYLELVCNEKDSKVCVDE